MAGFHCGRKQARHLVRQRTAAAIRPGPGKEWTGRRRARPGHQGEVRARSTRIRSMAETLSDGWAGRAVSARSAWLQAQKLRMRCGPAGLRSRCMACSMADGPGAPHLCLGAWRCGRRAPGDGAAAAGCRRCVAQRDERTAWVTAFLWRTRRTAVKQGRQAACEQGQHQGSHRHAVSESSALSLSA